MEALRRGETVDALFSENAKRLRSLVKTARTVESVGRDEMVIRLIVPAGTKGAAYVHPFPQPGLPQAEFLLNAGTRLRMIDKSDTLWTLSVEPGDTEESDENEPR